MNYQDKITLRNKHHISSALYHLERVMADNVFAPPLPLSYIGVHDLDIIIEQLKFWEKKLYITAQDDSN